jgi:hypothetical protein
VWQILIVTLTLLLSCFSINKITSIYRKIYAKKNHIFYTSGWPVAPGRQYPKSGHKLEEASKNMIFCFLSQFFTTWL